MTAGSPKYLYIMQDLMGGGAERVTVDLLSHLPKEGIDIDLLLFKDIRDYDTSGLRGVEIKSLFGPKDKIARQPHKFISGLVRAAKPYDVLIAGLELWPSYATSLVGWLLGKKVVWINHTTLSSFMASHGMPAYHRHLTRMLGAWCDHLIAVSEGARDDLVKNIGIPGSKITVINNPHEIAEIQRLAKEEIPREDMAIFGRPVIVSAGRIWAAKGFDVLIRAFKLVLDRGCDCNLAIFGSGEKDELLALAKSLGVESRVFLPGFRDNPYRYFARSQVFALSSRLEGFPRVLVEAMACGVPVVSTDCPSGPSEILEGGKHGVLVPTEDHEALAEALYRILSDTGYASALAAAAVERSWNFDAATMAQRYAEVLQSL